jgi:ribosomal protein S18 acetylase RimI-like enzyme
MKITYEFISPTEFLAFFKLKRNQIFSDDFDFDIEAILSTEEKEKRKHNWKSLADIHRYYLVAKVEEKIVGWSFGMQKSAEDYYMINSAVLPEYRRQKIYSKMMKKVVELLSNLGYQRIFSRHKMSNNKILIPKLKFGFIITGFEVNDVFGNLIVLSYYTNPDRRALLEVRMGTMKPNDDQMKLIK